MTVNKPSPTYIFDENSRHLARTLLSGQDALHRCREKYLPRAVNESDDTYNKRLKKSHLVNYYSETIKDIASRILSKPIRAEDSLNDQIREYLEDIDLRGNNLSRFLEPVIEDSINAGVSFILVDAPSTTVNTLAELNNFRPYLTHVHSSQVIGIIEQNNTVSQVRILRKINLVDPNDEFSTVEQTQVLVLEPNRRRVYSSSNNFSLPLIDEVNPLGYIPLVPVYSNKIGELRGAPLLQALAQENLYLYQTMSDQINILQFARIPVAIFSGIQSQVDYETGETTDIPITPGSVIRTESPDFSASYLEHSGQAINSGRMDVEDSIKRINEMRHKLF